MSVLTLSVGHHLYAFDGHLLQTDPVVHQHLLGLGGVEIDLGATICHIVLDKVSLFLFLIIPNTPHNGSVVGKRLNVTFI